MAQGGERGKRRGLWKKQNVSRNDFRWAVSSGGGEREKSKKVC